VLVAIVAPRAFFAFFASVMTCAPLPPCQEKK
jgi:hypothetical protein